MRILILGAGSSGRRLASRLCAEQHDVVLVDRNQTALDRVEASLDVLSVHGGAADPRVLKEAGLDKSDLLVAVTNSDSVNLLACALAEQVGVSRTVARVGNDAFTCKDSLFDLKELGIDLVVNQQQECARDLYNMLRIPGAQEVVDLMGGRVLCVGVQLGMDCPLLSDTLKDSPHKELLSTLRFVAFSRGGKLKIPRGETQFVIGDVVYLIGEPDPIKRAVKFLLPAEDPYTRVVIAGGGELGLQLGRSLERSGLDLVLVEENGERAEHCSELLQKTLVIQGNALQQETLQELGIHHNTAFVAVTGDDENNIMSCLVAEKMGAHFTISRVDKGAYVPIIDHLSLVDRVVSPHSSLINAIYHFVRGTNVKRDRLLQKIDGEVLEFVLQSPHPWIDRSVGEIKLPRGAMISMVLRGDLLKVATGDLQLRVGDRVLLFGLPKAIKNLDELLAD